MRCSSDVAWRLSAGWWRNVSTSIEFLKGVQSMVTARFPRSFARVATTAALAGAIGLSGGAAVMAQSATPAADTAMEIIDPSQCVTPSAPLRVSDAGTAMASPVADAELEFEEITDEAVVAEATAAIENLYACFNAGDGVSFVMLYTDQGIAANYGEVARDRLAGDTSTVAEDAPAHSLEVEAVVDYSGTPAVQYQITLGHQVWRVMDVLVQHEDVWVVDDTLYANPTTDLDVTTASVKVIEAEGGIGLEVTPNPVMNQPAVRLQLDSQVGEEVYLALLQGEGAMDLEALELNDLPEGVTFIGEEVALPDYRVEALFENLPEGDYVLFVDGGDQTATMQLTIDPPFDPNA